MKFKQIMIGLTLMTFLFTATACNTDQSKNETTEATNTTEPTTQVTTQNIELAFDAEAISISFINDLMK